MQTKAFPRIGETLYTSTLPNGLTLHIVPKPGFRSFYAVFATNYGGAHRRFTLDGQTLIVACNYTDQPQACDVTEVEGAKKLIGNVEEHIPGTLQPYEALAVLI